MNRLKSGEPASWRRDDLHSETGLLYATVDSIEPETSATLSQAVALSSGSPSARAVTATAQASAEKPAEPSGRSAGRPSRPSGRARRLLRAAVTWGGWLLRGDFPDRVREWRQQRRDAAAVVASGLFDADWYARTYPDVAPPDAARHYVRTGAAEGRSPGPSFDGPWYVSQHPEIAQIGGNPLLHYLANARRETARIRPVDAPPPPARPLTRAGYAAWLADRDEPTRADWSAADDRLPAGAFAVAVAGDPLPGAAWCLVLAPRVVPAPAALTCFAAEAARAGGGCDVITADEDVRGPDGARQQPRFQPPTWDPDLLRATGYIGSGLAVRREVLAGLGLATIPDLPCLLLRLASAVPPSRVRHLPAVLLHAPEAPVWPVETVRRALATEGIDAVPQPDGGLRLRHAVPAPAPFVSILVPTRDQPDLLERCVRGLLHNTDYPAFEVLILDNGSRDPRTLRLLRRVEADPRVRVIRIDAPFDWCALNNRGAQAARGDLLLLLNDDVAVREPSWLGAMVGLACRPDVGAVGATLLYPDGTIQHAGIALHPPGRAAHLMRHAPETVLDQPGGAGAEEVEAGVRAAHLRSVRSVAAVTGACLLLRREVFAAIGGLAEGRLLVSWNDIDLCLRVRALGLRVLCTPYARLIHREGASRGRDDEPVRLAARAEEYAYMRRTWGDALCDDPHLSPNLGVIDERLVLASRPSPGPSPGSSPSAVSPPAPPASSRTGGPPSRPM